jgi:dolichol kinase
LNQLRPQLLNGTQNAPSAAAVIGYRVGRTKQTQAENTWAAGFVAVVAVFMAMP